MAAVHSSSFLSVVKQTSPFEERVTRNGIQRDIHVVIKNSPFMVHMAAARNCDLDLNHVAFEASLLYDTEGEKGVDFVKVKPIEFKCTPNETGDQVAVELRIKVLTSQHEDMFFKVRIQGQDPVTKQDVPHLKIITSPIKVISKPEQLKKRGSNAVANPAAASVAPVAATGAAATNSKKRTVNDMVVEAVTRIEKHQDSQSSMLERILQCVTTAQQHAPVVPKQEPNVFPVGSWDQVPTMLKLRKDSEPVEFESCFVQLLKTFQSIDPMHRAEKVRRIARGLSVQENEGLSEFVDMLMTEGLGIDAGREASQPINVGVHNSMEKMDNYFFTSVMPSYVMNNSINNSMAGVSGMHAVDDMPIYLTTSHPNLQLSNSQMGLPLANSHDFLL